MLDGENFLKSGWVHGLRLTRFETEGKKVRYFIMGKVSNKITVIPKLMLYLWLKVKHSRRLSAIPLILYLGLSMSLKALCLHRILHLHG